MNPTMRDPENLHKRFNFSKMKLFNQ